MLIVAIFREWLLLSRENSVWIFSKLHNVPLNRPYYFEGSIERSTASHQWSFSWFWQKTGLACLKMSCARLFSLKMSIERHGNLKNAKGYWQWKENIVSDRKRREERWQSSPVLSFSQTLYLWNEKDCVLLVRSCWCPYSPSLGWWSCSWVCHEGKWSRSHILNPFLFTETLITLVVESVAGTVYP